MIQNLARRTCVVQVSNFSWSSLLEELSNSGHQGVIYGAKKEVLSRFGVDAGDVAPEVMFPGGDSVSMGEMFLPAPDLTVYLKVQTRSAAAPPPEGADSSPEENVWDDPGQTNKSKAALELRLEVGQVGPLGVEDAVLESLVGDINNAFKKQGVRDRKLKWDARGVTEPVDPPFLGINPNKPDDRSMELANLLRDGKLDGFLSAFRSGKNSLVLDEFMSTIENREETEYYIDKLFELDFLGEEIVVFDRNTGQAAIRAKDRAALQALKDAGITMPNGEPIEEQRISRLITLPDQNREYVMGTWTIRTFLINMLIKIGYSTENIYVSDAGAKVDLLFAPGVTNHLLFVVANERFTDDTVKAMLGELIEMAEPVKVIAYSPMGFDVSALDLLQNDKNVAALVTLENLDEFNTKLLEELAADRREAIAAAFTDMSDQLRVDLGALAKMRHSDDE
ncbi:MAG: hypothetical protein H6684_04270 [Deltaproteobacteria bacterium]|nr:hypothetical protein [Deltaproteobacteria bacterium]